MNESNAATDVHRVNAALVLMAWALVALGCREPRASAPTPSAAERASAPVNVAARRLTFGVLKEPVSLCSHVVDDPLSHELIALVSRGLTVRDANGALAPDLAAARAVIDTLPDGRTRSTWMLRRTARWQDGTQINPRDVILPWRLQTDPGRQQIHGRDVAARIESIAPGIDGQSVIVTWKRAVGTAEEPHVHVLLPAHQIERELIMSDGTIRALADSSHCRKPLSNGPFVLEEWSAGKELRFARNPHADPAPRLDQIVVKIFLTVDALEAALRSGAVDATLPNGGLTVAQSARFVRVHSDAFSLLKAHGLGTAHIDFNLEDPILKDLRVRQAIGAALSPDQIFDPAVRALYEPASSYLPSGHWARTDVEPLTYDPVRAAALLDDAGFHVPAVGGVRTRADGAKLELRLAAGADQDETRQMVERIKDALGKIGVAITLELSDFASFRATHASGWAQRQLTFYSWIFDSTFAGSALWRSDRIPSVENGFRGMNTCGYRNEEVTRFLQQADEAADPMLKKALLAQAQTLVRRDLPALPIYYRPSVAIVRKSVRNVAPTGTDTPVAWNAARWDVEQEGEP